MASEEGGILTKVRSEKTMADNPGYNPHSGEYLLKGGLDGVEWVKELKAEPGATTVLSVGAMASHGGDIDPDHMFLSMMRQDLIKDIKFVWNSKTEEFHTIIALGLDIAGHPRITHGGFSAAVLDETTGGLVFECKKAGTLGPGRAFTARLEVDYKKPMPVDVECICTARISSTSGRKIWTEALLCDRPGGEVFAIAKALYVTERQPAAE